MTQGSNVGKPTQLRRLLPLKHQLSFLESEVNESRSAIQSLLVSDESMAKITSLTLSFKMNSEVPEVGAHAEDLPSPEHLHKQRIKAGDEVETILVAYRLRPAHFHTPNQPALRSGDAPRRG